MKSKALKKWHRGSGLSFRAWLRQVSTESENPFAADALALMRRKGMIR